MSESPEILYTRWQVEQVAEYNQKRTAAQGWQHLDQEGNVVAGLPRSWRLLTEEEAKKVREERDAE